MKDHYCAAPFRHLALIATIDRYRPCCMWNHEIVSPIAVSEPNPMNHEWMQQLRQHMLSGEPHAGCSKCYDSETSREWSLRLGFNETYGRATEGELRDIEVNLGNLCNLKCRMCGSWGSSKWIADEIKMGKTPRPAVRRTVDDIKIDFGKLEKIKFLGGEPSLEQDAILEILQRIAAARGSLDHLGIEIITNGMIPFNDDIIALLRTCRMVHMKISMDGIGHWNEYQRTDSVWSDIEQTARFYHSLTSPSWQLVITSCITMFTVGGVTQLCDWVTTELPLAKQILQPIFEPHAQTLRNLPHAYKQKMISMLESWVPAQRTDAPDWLPQNRGSREIMRKSLLWHLKQIPNCSLEEVKKQIIQLDSLRNRDLQSHDPMLYEDLFG